MEFDQLLLEGSLVVLVAIVSSRIGARLGLPSLLLFLGLGMLLGDAGFGIHFSDADLAHHLGFAALVLILAEGGLTTRWVEIRGSIPVAGLLATVGIGVSVGLCFLFGHYVLGLPPWIAVLLGAVCSPTDSAAVFSVLRRVPLPARVRSTLEAESGLNDAPTVLLVTAASAYAGGHGEGGLVDFVAHVAFELTGGLFCGIVLGWFGVKLLRNIALPSSGLYPLAALVWSVLAYATGVALHTSGFAAVYVCAVMLGNGRLPHRQATRSFVEGIGWIAQIGLFVMLGLLASPKRVTLAVIVMALLFGVFLTFVARPASVIASAVWSRVPWREQAFLSWAGLRGAVPIILATVPLVDRVPGAEGVFDIVLVFVIVFTLVQAPTLPWVARRLGLVDGGPTDVEVEVAPMERINAELVQVRIPDESQLGGVAVGELRLPRDTVVSLVIRDGEPSVPDETTVLRPGDELLVVTPSRHRAEVEERLHDVGQLGRLARWRRGLEPPEEDVD